MPSPLAHVGIALALPFAGWPLTSRPFTSHPLPGLRQGWQLAAWCALASILPDFDVAPMLLWPEGIAWHRGPSHSLLGALSIGLLLVALRRLLPRDPLLRNPGQDRLATLCILFGALSHVPLDWSTGEPGAPSRYGVPLFWPFSSQKYIASNPWFGAFGIDREEGLGAMFGAEAVRVYGRELLTVAGAWLLAWGWRVLRAGGPLPERKDGGQPL